MRLFAWLFAPDTNWHKDSLAYYERSNRHTNSLDPNYWKAIDDTRSTAGNLKEYPAPYKPSTPWEKRNARFTGRLFNSVIQHARYVEARAAATRREEAETNTRFVN